MKYVNKPEGLYNVV